MSYILRKGLLVPKREIVRKTAAHVRVPRVDIILRRPTLRAPYFPISRPVTSALAIDGNATGSNSTGTATSVVSGTLTTVNTNDIIVALAFNSNAPNAILRTVSSVTATGLSFTKRSAIANSTGFFDLEVWWAPATSTFSGTITANWSGVVDDTTINVFGVSGANTSTPWDANASLPKTLSSPTGSAAAPSVTGVSTSNANDMLLGFVGGGGAVVETAGAGFTLINTVSSAAGITSASERNVVAATQSSITVAFGTTFTNTIPWLMIADAIVAAAAAGGAPVLALPRRMFLRR